MTEPTTTPPLFLKTETGPISLEFLMYSSIEDYDRDAGFAGAALEYACRWHAHRETIDIFGDRFTPRVEQLSGIKRGINEKETEKRRAAAKDPLKVTPVPERFGRYLYRVFAQVSKDIQSQIKAEALELSRTILTSAAPAVRSLVIEPMYYKRADSLLLQDLDTINEKVSKFASLIPDFVLERDASQKPLRDSLARLCQAYDAARWAQEE